MLFKKKVKKIKKHKKRFWKNW